MVGRHFESSLTTGAPLAVRIDILLDSSLDFISQVLAAEKCSLMLLAKGVEELVIKKARGLDQEVISQAKVRLGDGVAGWVALNRRPILAETADDFPGLARRYAPSYATKSFVSVPILADSSTGVLNVADKRNGASFTNADLLFLRASTSLLAGLLDLQEETKAVHSLALTDGLTGLGNWRFFKLHLVQELAQASRNNRDLAVLLIDIDHLKDVNYRYGHKVGNKVLQSVGRCLEQEIRRSDISTRCGADEFAVILTQTGAHIAETVAQRLIMNLARHSLPEIREWDVPFTLSVGISSYPILAADEDQLINQARAALQAAKRSSTQRIVTWQFPTDGFREARRLGIPYLPNPVELLSPTTAHLVPLQVAYRYSCVPVGLSRGGLTVAVSDYVDSALLKTLARITHLSIHPVTSTPAEIVAALNRLTELWGKTATADIVIRKMRGHRREVEISVAPLLDDANLWQVMCALKDACFSTGVSIKSVESYLMTVTTDATGGKRLLDAWRGIGSLLIESVRTEERRSFEKLAEE